MEFFSVSFGGGVLGISPIPGRLGDYSADSREIFRWKPNLVLTMTTSDELQQVEATSLSQDLKGAGIQWQYLPILDFGAPDKVVEAAWSTVSNTAQNTLEFGGKVLILCFGGQGRSGMAALRVMVDGGHDPHTALALLRSVRPEAVETDAQMAWATRGVLEKA